MQEFRAKLNENGRIVIPVAVRRYLHLKPGEELILHIEKEELHLYKLNYALKKARTLIKKYAKRKNLIKTLKEMRKQDKTE